MTEREVFEAALEVSPADRAVFLESACLGDAPLQARLEALLRQHDEAGSFLEGPALTGALQTNAIPREQVESVGQVIAGRFKLLEPIGEGGMGTVWMAQQSEPIKRFVAIKLIKAGMDSKQVLARFDAERQALALMDHPNIAKVFDAGTTDRRASVLACSIESNTNTKSTSEDACATGRPYFVMELVKGVPITKYCDEHHLTPRQRLELFIPVCHAIQHAHQKGIIHRDIKPSNVLVALYDDRPVPKVIDFGVAKATGQQLTEATLHTSFGAVVGTIEYMSPEQTSFNQLDVDTRSDIYSLGVLLYELLAGSPPFTKKDLEKAGMMEMLRVIREQEPSKPSTKLSSSDALPTLSANRGTEPKRLTRLVRGELDWIVMKALEKDRSRRYETANGFAMDVQRYLADEAVLACPPSAGYRLRKFAHRNKGGLAVAALVLFFLVLLGSGVGWAVRDRSARHAKVAGQVELIVEEVERLAQQQKWPEALAVAKRAEAAVAGGEADAATAQRVSKMLKDLEFIDRLEQIRMEAATSIEGKFNTAGADREYSRAFREYGVDVEALAAETSIERLKTPSALAIPLAAALDDWIYSRRQFSETDLSGWKRLVAVARGIDVDPLRDRLRSTWGHPVSETQDELRRLADSIDIRAQQPATLVSLARTLTRTKQADSAIRILRHAQYVNPGDFWLNFELGFALYKQQDHDGAIRFYTAAVSIRPNSARAHSSLGFLLANQKKLDEAIICFRKAIDLSPHYANPYNSLGAALLDQKKLDEAIAAFRQAINLDPKYANPYNNLGAALREQEKLDEAIAAFRKAIELDPKHTIAYSNLGNVLRIQKKFDEAVAAYHKAIEIDPKSANGFIGLGNALRDQTNLDEAIVAYRKAIDLDPKSASVFISLGNALRDQKKLPEAIVAYRKAVELNPKSLSVHNILGDALRDTGDVDGAIDAYQEAIELDPKQASTYDRLGRALAMKKDFGGAVAALRTAVEMNPNSAGAYLNLGNYLRLQGKLDEAISAYRKSIELDPSIAATAYGYLGLSLHDQKKWDEAIAAYHKAIQIAPKYAFAYNGLGNALRGQNKPGEAIAFYRKVVELNPKHPSAHVALGNSLLEEGWNLSNRSDLKVWDPKRALELGKEAIDLAPNSSFAWQYLGWIYYRTGNWKTSIEALEKSCKLQKGGTGDSGQWIVLALAHAKLAAQDGLPEKEREHHKSQARHWYDQADKKMKWRVRPDHEVGKHIWDFRAEARELLGVNETKD